MTTEHSTYHRTRLTEIETTTTYRSGRLIEIETTTNITPLKVGSVEADKLVMLHRTYAGGNERETTIYWAQDSVREQFAPLTHAQYASILSERRRDISIFDEMDAELILNKEEQ